MTSAFCHVHAFRYVRKAVEVLPKGVDQVGAPEYKCFRYYQKVFDMNKKAEIEAKKKYKNDNEKIFEYIKIQRDKRVKPLYVKLLEKHQINQKCR